MIEVSMMEVALFLTNTVSWALYVRAEEKRRGAEIFARALIQDDEIREKVVREYKAFEEKRA